MTEITAKEIILKNRAGEYLIPYTIPYTAGDGISIDADGVISATNTTYTAGDGIDITDNVISLDSSVAAANIDLSNLSEAGQAVIDDKVSKTGDTMTGQLTCQTNQAWQFADVVKGTNPEVAKYIEAIGIDSTGTDTSSGTTRIATVSTSVNTAGQTSAFLQAYDFTEGSTNVARMGIYYPKGGTPYTYAPTPANNDDSTKIATTAFVSNMLTSSNSNFITYKKASSGYIKFANGIIIQWGSATMTATSITITYPTAFSGGMCAVLATDGVSTNSPAILSKTQFKIWSQASAGWVWWCAIGY